MLRAHYGKPVILLMDEYDVPVAKASSNGYYQEMLNVVKAIMSTALKDNPSLKFAVITGCLKITKESIFTGTNNFVSDSISSNRLNEYFGFTDTDVTQILQDAKLSEHMPAVKMSRVFQKTVMRRSGRLIHACTPKSWRMIMTRYCVMEFHFLRNGA